MAKPPSARDVSSAFAAVKLPCCRAKPTIGRRSANISRPAGKVNRATRRMPSEVTSIIPWRSRAFDVAGHLRLERRGDRHRQQAVGEDEQDVRLGVRVRVAGARVGEVDDRDRRDLVEHDVAERPARQAGEQLDRRVAEVRVPPQPDVGRACIAGIRATAMIAMPPVAPRASVQRRARSVRMSSTVGGWSTTWRDQRQGGDDHHVRQHRRPRRGEEPAVGVEQRGGQGDEAVEEDLDEEDPGERGAGGAVHVGVAGRR